MAYDMGMGYGSSSKKSKGKKDKAYNATYSGESNTMPMSNKSWANYGLSSSKITRRSAK